jgi:hypothetical protein
MPGFEGTMKEWKSGDLHSGSKKGPVVNSQKQALAIAFSQARKAGDKKGFQGIASAIKKPGALHRDLGVPQGQKIPAKKLSAARSGKMGATVERRANLAKTLSGFHGVKK